MPQAKHRYVSGPELVTVLSVTVGIIKLANASGTVTGQVMPDQAVLIAKAGSYVGKCNRALNKVYMMRQQDVQDARKNDFDWEYRVGRPMLNAYQVKDLTCWDRSFQRDRISRLEKEGSSQCL